MPQRTYGFRMTMLSAGLAVTGVLVAVLTENVWLGVGLAVAGVAFPVYTLKGSPWGGTE